MRIQAILWCFYLTALLPGCTDGIHASPSGNAAYLEGESCTIQVTDTFEQDLLWCQTQYGFDRSIKRL